MPHAFPLEIHFFLIARQSINQCLYKVTDVCVCVGVVQVFLMMRGPYSDFTVIYQGLSSLWGLKRTSVSFKCFKSFNGHCAGVWSHCLCTPCHCEDLWDSLMLSLRTFGVWWLWIIFLSHSKGCLKFSAFSTQLLQSWTFLDTTWLSCMMKSKCPQHIQQALTQQL